MKSIIQRVAGILGMVLAGFGVYHCGSTSESDHVTFLRLDPAALEGAFADRRPVVIYVTSCTDSACQAQDAGALKDPRVIAALAPFVRFKLATVGNARMNGMLSEQMTAETNATALPMFHFFGSGRSQTAVLLGVQSADSLIAAAAKTLKP